jgi:transketolase
MTQAKKINNIKKLKLLANQIRHDIITSLTKAKSGHSAGSLGMADVFTAMYFNILKHDPKKPTWKERDILILSNGHICPVQYAAMANTGYFPRKELNTLRKLGTRLQGHPHRTSLPGLESSSGPLGSGLSQAAGMALTYKIDKRKNRVFCITSDGEHDCGQTWEAVMFAARYKLDNITAILDRNNIQIDGTTENIMPLDLLKEKYEAFNWHVIEIDGNNIHEIIEACNKAKTIHEQPTMIIAHNIPGKGISFMENDYTWHGKPPTKEQEKIALEELNKQKTRIQKGTD